MKKYFSLFIIMLMTPILVLADSAGPSILGYDAIISNKNGIIVTDYDEKEITFAYNTKIYVEDENSYEGTVTFCLEKKEHGCEGDTYTTKGSNITIIKKEVTPSDFKDKNNFESALVKEKREYIVINKSGIKLSKGPGDYYDKYDKTIPNKEVIYTTHIIARNEEKGFYSWGYVDSNGYKGWVNVESTDLWTQIEPGMALGATDLLDDDNNVIEKIESETMFTEAFRGSDDRYYVKYNGKYGFVKDNDNFKYGYAAVDADLLALKDTSISSSDGKTLITVPEGEKVSVLYYYGDEKYYVEYNEKKGFINRDDTYGLTPENDIKKIAVSEDLKLYDSNMISEYPSDGESLNSFIAKFNSSTTIPKGSTITVYDYSIHNDNEYVNRLKIQLVKYKGKVGCLASIYKISDEVEEEEETTSPTATPEITPSPTATPEVTPNENETQVETPTPSPTPKEEDNTAKKTDGPDKVIIICIIASVIISFVSIVAAVSINKKSKAKEEPKPEVPKKEETIKKPEPIKEDKNDKEE